MVAAYPPAGIAQPRRNIDGLLTAVAGLSRTATGQFSVGDLLRRLVELAAEHLDVDGAGVMVSERSGGLVFSHASSEAVDRVERLQELMQQGPCRESVRELREVVVADLSEQSQPDWQPYLAGAVEVGLRSVVAMPLVSRGRSWGVLDLYRRWPGRWDRSELAMIRLLADVAVSYVVMALDRDEARQAQHELAHRSLHDELTGLPNRTLLFDRLEHALIAATRHQQTVAVFFIDLDGFKKINDTLGHAAGDTALIAATRRISATLRQEDTLARLAGDEFVLVCEPLARRTAGELEGQLQAVTARIHAALAPPVRIGGTELSLSASIGVALSDSGSSADDLLADADAAMYRAKQRRHSELVIREHAGSISFRSVRRLDRELATALAAGQLQVHYQPIVSTPGMRVEAVEALLRWQHPEHGLLPASEFIELAENSGLVIPIGHWVLDTVCAQLRDWQDALGNRAPATAYVNLSTRELCCSELMATLESALSRHRLRPEQLGLELLEASYIDPRLLPVLRSLHARGHALSVDDFGTGYSSLSRLIELPVAFAKIDRSFVSGVGYDPRCRAFVDAVLVVARNLDLQVIAEGVETAEQASRLQAAGCLLLQGRYLGAPEPASVLTDRWSAES